MRPKGTRRSRAASLNRRRSERGHGADLRGARLCGVRLNGANLTEARLDGAELDGVDLTTVTMTFADLSAAKNVKLGYPERGAR